MNHRNLLVVLIAVSLFWGIQSFTLKAPAVNSKFSPAVQRFLEQKTTQSTFPILIILKDQADLSAADNLKAKEDKGAFVYKSLTEIALKTQGPLVAYLQSEKIKFHQFYIYNMIAVWGAKNAVIKNLGSRSDVSRIISNPSVNLEQLPQSLTTHEALSSIEDSIVSTGAPRVWSELNVHGEGIVVAGQDTGVQWDHPALKKQYRGWVNGKADHDFNWHDSVTSEFAALPNRCGYNLPSPCDDGDHGTHTMGTMVGDDGKNNKIGMAPGAKWMACRNMDGGLGRPTTYIDCFEFFLAPYKQGANPMTDGEPKLAPHVVNNSWTCPATEGCDDSEMMPVLQAMAKAGIMVVVSASNDGPGCSTITGQPATFSGLTLRVGAHNHHSGKIAFFSSRGPSAFDGGIGPDVTAPGISIRSSIPGDAYAGGWSGTSMAGPHVAGLVALIWSAHPDLIGNITKTIDIIEKTAIPSIDSSQNCGGVSGKQIPNNTFGYGRIDAYRAVTEAN